MIGRLFSEEHRLNLSKANTGKKQILVNCPHCNKIGGIHAMHQWYFDNCKFNTNL